MSDPRFGRSTARVLHRLRPVPVDPEDLLEVALEVLPRMATSQLRLVLTDDRVDGPVLALREDERATRTSLRDLAEDMTAAGVGTGPDARQVAVGWRVVVRRDTIALPWTPAPATSPGSVARVRTAAITRSAGVATELRVEGPVALWSHAAVPLLASAPFVAPERVLDRVAAAGLSLPDMQIVLTPGRPVAGAVAGVAARLAGSTGEPCVRLPWQALSTLPWL